MRILGIDPGSLATGYGVVEVEGSRLRRVAGGVIRVRASGPLSLRLARIHSGLADVISAERPEAAALEAVFLSRNARSALQLGQARGAALCACGAAGLETAEYTPARVKTAVAGYGRASKSQIQAMVARLLALDSVPPSDEADALAVAICHAAGMRAAARTSAALRASGAAQRGARP